MKDQLEPKLIMAWIDAGMTPKSILAFPQGVNREVAYLLEYAKDTSFGKGRKILEDSLPLPPEVEYER